MVFLCSTNVIWNIAVCFYSNILLLNCFLLYLLEGRYLRIKFYSYQLPCVNVRGVPDITRCFQCVQPVPRYQIKYHTPWLAIPRNAARSPNSRHPSTLIGSKKQCWVACGRLQNNCYKTAQDCLQTSAAKMLENLKIQP